MRSSKKVLCGLGIAAIVAIAAASPGRAAAAPDRVATVGRGVADAAQLKLLRGLLPVPRRAPSRSPIATPLVEGPIAGNPFIAATSFDLASVGYEQAEYFISGDASAYANVGELGSDGKWKVAPAASTPYKTRIVVYRPIEPRDFKGTVLVEWLNVSGGLDSSPDWLNSHVEMIRSGMTWVGVSAQFVGVEGGSAILGQASTGLKQADPMRYGSLHHPGDSFSFDMFSQAGQAVRRPDGVDPLGGLVPKRVIAAGESQSAFRMVTYVNAVDPIARVYDGFLVHSRGGGSAPLSQTPQAAIETPEPARIRSDVRVPVLTFQTETDLVSLGFFPDRQPDSARFRLWEVAGTAHADTYTLSVGFTDTGDSPDAAEIVITAEPIPGIIVCARPVNSGPQHFVLNAAVAALDRWIRDGTPPPRAPRLQVTAGSPPVIERDEHGNALGGIRTSYVDVPIATLSGEGQTGAAFCGLFGTTVLFDDAKLGSLYPSHAAYTDDVARSTDRAVRAGFLRKPDARLIKDAALASDVGK